MKISIIIEALTATFETDIKRASKEAQKAAREMERQFKAAGAVIGASLAVAGLAVAALTKQAIDNADSMAKLSQKVGVSVESLSTLGYAADRAGVPISGLQGGLVKLTKNASDAGLGLLEAQRGFDALGISVKDADGNLKNSDVLLREIAGQFATFKDGAAKTALAVQLFGRSGAELIPLLNAGADGLEALEERARSLGLELDTNTAKQAERFNDLMADVGSLAQGAGISIATQLLPALEGLTEGFVDNGIQARGAGDGVKVFTDFIKGGIAASIVLKNGVEAATSAIGAQIDVTFAAVKAAGELAAKYNPITGIFNQFGGAVRSNSEILEEFNNKASAAASSGLSGIDAEILDVTDAFESLFAAMEQGSGALDGPSGLAPGMENTAEAAKTLSKALAALKRAEEQHRKELMANESEAIKLRQAADALTASFKRQEQAIRNDTQLLRLSGAARAEFDIQLQAEALAVGAVGEEYEAQVEIFKKLLTEYEAAAEASDEAADRASELESILSRFDDIGFGGLRRELELVKEELEKATDPEKIARLQFAMNQLNTQVQIETIGSFKALLGTIQTFTDEGSSSFKTIEAGMAALSIVQDVLAIKAAVTAVLTQGQGEPYSAFARMAAMAAAVAPLIASIGLTLSSFGGGGSGGADVASGRQDAQGTGTILGDAAAQSESILNASEITADATSKLVGINTGMLRALQSLQSGLGSAANILARGADGAGFDPLAGPTPYSDFATFGIGVPQIFSTALDPLNILGGSSRITDQGIVIMAGLLEEVLIGAYQEVRSRSSIFSSYRTREQIIDAPDGLEAQFQLVIGSIVDTVRAGALALGLVPAEVEAAIAAYQIEETRISLKGLTGEEQQAELAAVFSAMFDGLAGNIVPFIDQFQRVGEGLGETLIRVATGVQVTQEGLRQLGFALDETDPERFAQVSESLLELTGGIEGFIEGMQSFVRNFATEEHQFAVAQDAITRAFEQVGIVIPATRDAMWELMQSLDATTEEGREQIATLLRLADVSDTYYTLLEDQAEDAAAAVTAAAEALADLEEAVFRYAEVVAGVNSSLAELDGSSDFQRTLRGIAQDLNSTVDALNDAARAAGLQAAREEDLAAAHTLAAMRAAQAIAALTAAGMEQGAALYGSALGDIEAQIASLTSSTSSTLGGFAGAITQVSQAASDAINLLLGDLSPLKDAQKLPLALQALQRGEIGGDEVLRIAQRMFASGADYNRIFAQVQQIVGSQQVGGDPGGGGPVIDTRLLQLEAERDRLLAEQANLERFGQAQTLAQTIADIAGATGEAFEDVLARLTGGRATLETFAGDLQLPGLDELNEYLTALQADEYGVASIAQTLRSEFDYLLNGLRVIFDLPVLLPLTDTLPIIGERPVPNVQPVDFYAEAQTQHEETIEAERDTQDLLRELLDRLPAAISEGSNQTTGAVRELTEATLERRLGETAVRPRNLRTPAVP